MSRRWETRCLGDVVVIASGQVDPRLEPYRSLPHVGGDNIESETGVLRGIQSAGQLGLTSGKYAFDKSDVLYSKIRPNLNKVAAPDFAGICSADIYPVRPLQGVLSRSFLIYLLRSKDFLTFAETHSARTNIPKINRDALLAYEVAIPPLPEQRRIAKLLDKADELRAKRRAALAELDTLVQSIFLEMFGDPVVNPKGWPLEKLGKVGVLGRGVSKHRPRNAPDLLGGPYPLIQTGEVANSGGYIREYASTYSEFGLRQSKMWSAGTLCITIAANIAKTGILTFDACFPDSVVGFTAKDPATVLFVQAWMSFLQKTLEDTAPESAQKNINLAILRDLDVPLPSLALQRTFAARVAVVEKLKAAHRASLADLDALFASLQHRAFRGEL